MDVFVLPGTALSTSLIISPSLVSAKRIFSSSMINQKFSLNVCSFPAFSFVEIKSDDGYQIGRGYPLITILRFVSHDHFYPMTARRN